MTSYTNSDHGIGRVDQSPAVAFHLVPIALADDWRRLILNGTFASSPTVRISMSIVDYLYDVLEWAPTESGGFGFVFTSGIFAARGCEVLCRVLGSIRALLDAAPDIVLLTNRTDRGGGSRGNRRSYRKGDLLRAVDDLLGLARQTVTGPYLIYCSDMPDERKSS